MNVNHKLFISTVNAKYMVFALHAMIKRMNKFKVQATFFKSKVKDEIEKQSVGLSDNLHINPSSLDYMIHIIEAITKLPGLPRELTKPLQLEPLGTKG
jgi:hypothetical protein